MLSRFAESLNGATTIRSADAVTRILNMHKERVNVHNGVFRTMWEIGCWFGIHVDFLGALVVLGVSFFAVADVGNSTAEKSFVGVALTFALQFTSLLQWTVRVLIETENCMTSVERLQFYSTRIPVERDKQGSEDAVDVESWPAKGRIEIKDFCMRYRPSLPNVLSHLDMIIQPGETVGICGRTGAGKSSLISAMLRLCEGHSGGIFIDGVSIANLKLDTLRQAISYIPQVPFLFTSTVQRI